MQMVDNASEVIAVVREGAQLAMEPENAAKMAAVEQEIIDVQETVLALHKAKQDHTVSDAEYAARIKTSSERMQELEAQQAEMQTAAARYAEVKHWLDTFEQAMKDGNVTSVTDSALMKTLVERIMVSDTDIVIEFKCGGSIKQEYVK